MLIAEVGIEGDGPLVRAGARPPINFGDESLSDAILVVENQEFKVHKLILANSSGVFKTMFFENPETRGKDRIRIEDVKADTFRRFLELVYNGKISNVTEFLDFPMNENGHYHITGIPARNGNPAPPAPHTHYADSLYTFFKDFWSHTSEILRAGRRFNAHSTVVDYISPIINNQLRSCKKEDGKCHQCLNLFLFATINSIDVSNCQKNYSKSLFTQWFKYASSHPFPKYIPTLAMLHIFNKLKEDVHLINGEYLKRSLAITRQHQYVRTHPYQLQRPAYIIPGHQ